MTHYIIDQIKRGIPVIFDGAIGTEIQKKSVSLSLYENSPGCNELLNVTASDTLIQIHKDYLEAGAQIIQTNTFGGNRIKLKEYGLENRVYEINKSAAANACKAIHGLFPESKEHFVCGSLGPTGFLPSSANSQMSAISFSELESVYEEQAVALIDGGADMLRIETSQDLLEVRAAIAGIQNVYKNIGRKLPLIVQITLDINGHMLLGSTVEAFLGSVLSLNPDIVGINCSAGPKEMEPYIIKLLNLSHLPVAALPNAGMPENVDGKAFYNMEPHVFGAQLVSLVKEFGLSVVGGCCGTTPAHIKALSSQMKNNRIADRKGNPQQCWLSSGIHGMNIELSQRPVIIGERLNAQGSKKTREHLLDENYDELLEIANEQIQSNSSLLDICVAVNENDNELQTMSKLVAYLSERITIPLCVDSTEPDVIKAALQSIPGAAMINSINLEHGGEKARKILELASKFGCPVVALTIDEEGMARTVEKKLELTRKLRDLVCNEYRLPEHFLYIDPLVFTLAGGTDTSDAALMSLQALAAIKKEMPGIRTVMGVSNVSFGLKPKARRILNNLMLYHAVKAGLDAAIFNPLHIDDILSYGETLVDAGENLLFNKTPDALLRFVELFENQKESVRSTLAETNEQTALDIQLRNAILKRDRRNLKNIILALLESMEPAQILNGILLPSMDDVGRKMASGEMILPFVLQAAEIMKEAVGFLEPYLQGKDTNIKGTLLLATVYGDVHDIGKNLVGSILRNQGFNVVDLGKQVSIETIVNAVKKEQPVAIGLSALLVTTSRQMRLCVEEFDRLGIDIPILIGGAAVNKEYAERISVLGTKKYMGGVFFAKDAFEATRILDNVAQSQKTDKKMSIQPETIKSVAVTCEVSAATLEYPAHIEPPFWGTSDMLTWESPVLVSSIRKERLFKAEWGGGKLAEESYAETCKMEFEPLFAKLTEEITAKDLVDARGFYGLFPVITENENLIVLDPDNYSTELLSLTFPRVPKKHNRSIADYFLPEGDLLGIQVVTIGASLGNRCREYFQKENKYSLGYMLNGIGNYLVENLADRVTNEIRRSLGLENTIGRRYSFGYPGLPSLLDQKKLFELSGAAERLGLILTDGLQMDPEHSTFGIFVHHKDAEYLS
jgi:5-methyltetrahydrofolate--homocysteine methyltransferase